MSAQQARSAVTAEHRSIVPSVPGVPWWAAVLVAVIGTAVGFAFDAGSGKELTSAFAGLYVLGCLAAVLAVRQAGIFTAVIQPPLILFCAVPGAYFLFHGARFTGLKDLLINCGYPLIERFPLMVFTAGAVLLVGLLRWGLDKVVKRSRADARDDDSTEADAPTAKGSAEPSWLLAKLAAFVKREPDDDDPDASPARPRTRRTHAVERSTRSTTPRRTEGRPASSRARRPRPPAGETADPARRRRPTREPDGSEPPRRGRLPRDLEQRGRPPWDVRRENQARRGRQTSRSSRREQREPVDPYDAAPPPRRRPTPNGSARSTTTHHPISQVRYRNDDSYDARPRQPRKAAGDNWDYDS